MGRRKNKARCLGPYDEGHRWRVIDVAANGKKKPVFFESERLARVYVIQSQAVINEKTFGLAIDEYEVYLRDVRGNKPKTMETTLGRMRKLFPAGLLVSALDSKQADKLYASLRTQKVSVDTHRNTLNQARTFTNWLIAKGYLGANPFDSVKGVGKRRKGKPQLRLDEARILYKDSISRCIQGEREAFSILLAMVMGLRSSESCALTAESLDDDGTLLRVAEHDGKTVNAFRLIEIPVPLRPFTHLLPLGMNRDQIYREVRRTLKRLGLNEAVTPHGLRGTQSSTAARAGAASAIVAKELGHGSSAVTEAHYIDSGAMASGKAERTLKVLQGGRGS